MVKTGIVRDERYMLHDMGPFHPEKPERLEAIYAMLDEEEMAGKFQPLQNGGSGLLMEAATACRIGFDTRPGKGGCL